MRYPRPLVVGKTIAMRLEEAGFPQDTHFHWVAEVTSGRNPKLKNWKVKQLPSVPKRFRRGSIIAAPTDTEALNLLPRTFRKDRTILRLDIVVRAKGYAVGYKGDPFTHYEIGNTMGEAASLLYCYSKKNGYL